MICSVPPFTVSQLPDSRPATSYATRCRLPFASVILRTASHQGAGISMAGRTSPHPTGHSRPRHPHPPVGLRRVWQQLPCDGERHAAQGDAVRLHQAGGIVMADTLANQIEHLLGIRIARVHEAFRNLGGFTGDLLGDAQRAARQGIVFILPGAGDRVFRPAPVTTRNARPAASLSTSDVPASALTLCSTVRSGYSGT
nr:hypothetical protein 143p1_00001 [Serratia proteamaculans]